MADAAKRLPEIQIEKDLLMTIPLKDQIAEVGRELGMRKGVYAKWVQSGRMTQEDSDKHIARLDAVYKTLKWLEANREKVLQVGGAETIGHDGGQE